MRIAITGATGLLGRNLLFEFIKEHNLFGSELEIILLGRNLPNQSWADRVERMLSSDGADYLPGLLPTGGPARRRIRCVTFDLGIPGLGIDPEGLAILKRAPIDYFFHLEGLVDLGDTFRTVDALDKINFRGTDKLLEVVDSLMVGEFVYVSTAYCCGETTGLIKPDYTNFDQSFRNPYEISKLKAETRVRHYALDRGLQYRIFRPTVICGRLPEDSADSTLNFNIIYEWAAFFLRLKAGLLPEGADVYETPLQLPGFRLCYSLGSDLNIVPVDYAAKVMHRVCTGGREGHSFHLANEQSTPHIIYASELLREIGVTGIDVVESVPEDKSRLESLYYRHVGSKFTPYATGLPMIFDTSNLEGLRRRNNLCCPPIDEKAIRILTGYAREHDFGLDLPDRPVTFRKPEQTIDHYRLPAGAFERSPVWEFTLA